MHPHTKLRAAMAVGIGTGLLSALAAPTPAQAIYFSSGEIVEECAWSPVVRLPTPTSSCTGIYLGQRTFLTAAHCQDGGIPISMYFGEERNNYEFTVGANDIEDCHVRGDWDPGADEGTDIAVCRLAANAEVPDVPVVAPMVPTGCARDHLRWQIYVEHACQGGGKDTCNDGPDVTAIGMGCENASCTFSGNKRSMVGKLVEQEPHPGIGNGTTTKLVFNDTENSYGPVDGNGLQEGDSGGPLMYQLRDGSWRLIGLLHGTYSPVIEQFEAVPSYLHWIEDVAEADFTPCHGFVDGEWLWEGNCLGEFPLDIDESYDSWTNECSEPVYGGGYNACGAPLGGELDVQTMPDPKGLPLGVIAPAAALDEAFAGVLELARRGYFGRPVDRLAVKQAFVDAGWDQSMHLFLSSEMPREYIELYPTAEVYAARVVKQVR